ncbi:MAG: NAD-dependent epimerase/dehydratase family protein, partial [candidate division Zixibacteria bacterium]|nr:NAD-dependent epimerase/dehydratase family protein [candidate division Zixibacteria bacterium]
MRIFVTGGTGFIGTHLIRRLSAEGHRITCLVRRSSNTAVLAKLGVEFVIGDVTDYASLEAAIKDHECVINLANVYSFWEPYPNVYDTVNIGGTRNVMESALKAGVPKVVHISTGGIYGKPKETPFTEESEIGPERFSRYFQTKYEGDEVAWGMYKNERLPLV